ncbi:GGDEF domain-containing protein [Halomonas sp. NO4]|uniref:diguanylate cyclase domain-containing protein n=1 Tax=Halomonas sp. NO4 TaxID=2484813 RepID=UPI001F09FEC1|nr:GGDEF domain-containing protein [Halomonas sp. NO4]
MRPSDTVARFGGDEFVVVLPDLAYDGEAMLIAERLVESLSRPYRIGQHELHLSASIGVSLGQGAEHRAQVLIQQADMAMYKAKRRGRRTCELFTQDINDKLASRMQLRHDLEVALGAQQFELYYGACQHSWHMKWFRLFKILLPAAPDPVRDSGALHPAS